MKNNNECSTDCGSNIYIYISDGVKKYERTRREKSVQIEAIGFTGYLGFGQKEK